MPPRNYIIQCLTKAFTLYWDGPKFIKFTLRQLKQQEIDEIALEYQMILQDMKNKFKAGLNDNARAIKIDKDS